MRNLITYFTALVLFSLACEQALHLGGYGEKYTREWHARGDPTASPLARAFSRGLLCSPQ